jgi:hypothetical protein
VNERASTATEIPPCAYRRVARLTGMAAHKLSGGRVKRTRLLIPVLVLVMLVACTSDGGHDHPSVKLGGPVPYSIVPTGPFRSAGSWIRSLNRQGVPCRLQRNRHPDNAPFRYQDSGSCVFDNGHKLTVWIVRNAEKTYRTGIPNIFKHPLPRGPRETGAGNLTRYFYRQNWLVIATKSIPAQAIQTIRELFQARVRQT